MKSLASGVLSLMFAWLAHGATAPYPPSAVIQDIEFDFDSFNRGAPRDGEVPDGDIAKGSDIWVVTWADDGELYTSWGDGVGFGAVDFNQQRVNKALMGVSRITGMPDSWQGVNILGGKHTESPGSMAHGKPRGIISIDGVLYLGIVEEDTFDKGKMCRSTDRGLTWTTTGGRPCLASGDAERRNQWNWRSSRRCARGVNACGFYAPTAPLQFGKDYQGARDRYVYFYNDDPPSALLLARVPVKHIMKRSRWQFFAGLDRAGQARWTFDVTKRKPVFSDVVNGVGWGTAAMYHPILRRYLLTTRPAVESGSAWGLFDAPEPWGPWTTVKYFDSFRDATWKFTYVFNQKWMSADGLSLGMIFSGVNEPGCYDSPQTTDRCYDSINTIDATLVLRVPSVAIAARKPPAE